MADRASVYNKGQLGIETVPGTTVAATLLLQDTGFTPHPRVPMTAFRPHGAKFSTNVHMNKEYTECGFEGDLSYIDLMYFLAGLIGGPTAVGANTYKPNMWTPDTPVTYTVEYGAVASQAERFGYGLVNSLDIRVSDTEARMSGTMFGQIMAEAITPTPSLVPVMSNVVDSKDITIFVGDSVGSLTALARGFEFSFGFSDKYGRLVTLDASKPSYSGHVELAPRLTARLSLEQDSIGAGLMADLRAKKTKFVRMKCTSPLVITGTTHYDIQLTIPFKFLNPDRGDRQGVYVNNFELEPIYDQGLGSACEFVVVNG